MDFSVVFVSCRFGSTGLVLLYCSALGDAGVSEHSKPFFFSRSATRVVMLYYGGRRRQRHGLRVQAARRFLGEVGLQQVVPVVYVVLNVRR